MRAPLSTLALATVTGLAWPALAAEALCPGVSSALPPEPDLAAARTEFEASEEAYRGGRLRKSLRHACRAQELAPDKADLVFNVAQIYRNLGECRLATLAYQAYVERGEDAATLETARSYIAQLDECAPAESPVAPAPATKTTEAPTTSVESSAALPPVQVPSPVPPPVRDSAGVSYWTYGLGATALASAIVATVSAFRAASEHNTFTGKDGTAAEEAKTRGKNAEAMAWGFGAAAVLLGGSAVWIELSSDSNSQQRIGIKPLPKSVSARYELRF